MLATPSAAASVPADDCEQRRSPATREREPEDERRARRRARPAGSGRAARALHQRVAVALDVHVERVRGRRGERRCRAARERRGRGTAGHRRHQQHRQRREDHERQDARLREREIALPLLRGVPGADAALIGGTLETRDKIGGRTRTASYFLRSLHNSFLRSLRSLRARRNRACGAAHSHCGSLRSLRARLGLRSASPRCARRRSGRPPRKAPSCACVARLLAPAAQRAERVVPRPHRKRSWQGLERAPVRLARAASGASKAKVGRRVRRGDRARARLGPAARRVERVDQGLARARSRSTWCRRWSPRRSRRWACSPSTCARSRRARGPVRLGTGPLARALLLLALARLERADLTLAYPIVRSTPALLPLLAVPLPRRGAEPRSACSASRSS